MPVPAGYSPAGLVDIKEVPLCDPGISASSNGYSLGSYNQREDTQNPIFGCCSCLGRSDVNIIILMPSARPIVLKLLIIGLLQGILKISLSHAVSSSPHLKMGMEPAKIS